MVVVLSSMLTCVDTSVRFVRAASREGEPYAMCRVLLHVLVPAEARFAATRNRAQEPVRKRDYLMPRTRGEKNASAAKNEGS